VVELEAVHLGPDAMVIDLLSNRPAGTVEGRQPLLKGWEPPQLLLHRRRRIIGYSINNFGLMELPPFLEKCNQFVIGTGFP